jgi:serine protein kinase
MRTYPAFSGFHGMEETIERIVGFFRHAAQGLEERKQILYLLGPVGGGKSSLAERLKSLMEVHPIYVLKAADELSPVFESPLSLFNPEQLGPIIEDKYGIPRRRLIGLMSPWCYKRLEAFGGDTRARSSDRQFVAHLRRQRSRPTHRAVDKKQNVVGLVETSYGIAFQVMDTSLTTAHVGYGGAPIDAARVNPWRPRALGGPASVFRSEPLR